MGAWLDLGIGAAQAGVNTGLGMLSQLFSSHLNEKAAQRADLRGRKLYHDLNSPAAQVEQLKQAGLSPALLYAKGGVGGSAQAGAQAAPATNQIGNVFDLMQVKLMQAQIKNIDADTQKKLSDKGLVDEQILTEIEKRGLTQLQAKYQEVLTQLANYEAQFKASTIETDIEQRKVELAKLAEEYRKAYADAETANVESMVASGTANARIKQEMQAVLKNDLEIQAGKMNLKLTEKQIELIQQNIIEKHLTNAWINIKNETDIAKIKNDIQMELKRMNLAEDQQTYDMCMGVVDRFIDIIKPFGKGKK